MPYLPTLNAFLHSASQLLAAYPTARITTKYSLPKPSKDQSVQPTNTTDNPNPPTLKTPAATLTAKIYHAPSGICLKYSTDKAQEVGRLITSLGKLARDESIDIPATVGAGGAGGAGEDAGDRMDVDSGNASVVKVEDSVVTGKPVGGQQGQGQGQGQQGGGGKKKKKGKR